MTILFNPKKALDTIPFPMYLTYWLSTDGRRCFRPRHDLCRAGRPDAPRDPRASILGRGVGDRAREAVRDLDARDLPTSEGARARRPHRPGARGPVAPL